MPPVTRDALSSTARQTGPLSPNYRLIYERQQLNLTQDELAAQIGATKASIIRWEHGHLPSPYYRKQLCAFFGKSMQDLGWSDVEAERLQRGTAHPTLEVSGQMPVVRPFLAPTLPGHQVIGRESLLAALKEQLFNHKSLALSALDGLPGVGKTTLAIALAHDPQVRAHFTDGVLWAGLGRRADVLLHLGRWGMAMGMSHHELEKLPGVAARQQRLRAIMAERKLLLVADDVWERAVALELMVGGEQCAFLITTRLPTVAEYIAPESILLVHELSEDDGLALLGQLAPQVVKAAPEEALRLVRAVGGLPLALILVGKYLRGRVHSQQTTRQKQRNLLAALERLEQMEHRLRLAERPEVREIHPSLHPRAAVSLVAVIAMSEEWIEPSARGLLRALSVFPPKPNTFSEEAALMVGVASGATLDLLTNAGLLEGSGEDRYSLHQTIADYAKIKGIDETAQERLAKYFVDLMEQRETNYHLLERETDNIEAALQFAFERGKRAMLIRGANAFNDFLQTRGLYALAETHLNRAEEAARSIGDTASLATTLLHLGEIANQQGNYDRAEERFHEGLALAHKIGASEPLNTLIKALGAVAWRRGNYEEARRYLQESLTLSRQIGERESISSALADLGWVIHELGDYKQAETYFQEGLSLARQVGSLQRIGVQLTNLAVVENSRGSYAQSEVYLMEALTIFRQIGHRERVCLLLTNLGVAADNQGNYDRAEAYYKEGLSLAQQIGHLERISGLLENLGIIANKRGRYKQAESYLRESLEIARRIGLGEQTLSSLNNLGIVSRDQGDYEQAEVYLQEGLALARRSRHPELISAILESLGAVARSRTDHRQAAVYLQESLELAREIEYRDGVSNALREWGELNLEMGQLDLAAASMQEALSVAPEGDQALFALLQYGLSRIVAAQGDAEKAFHYGQASQSILEKIGHGRLDEVKQWMATLVATKNKMGH